MAMSLPVQVAQGHNSQGDPNISLRTLIRSEFFPSQSHDMTGKTIFPFFFDGSLRHWLQAFVFVFVTWGKPIHLDILPDNAPGSVKIRPTTVWRSRDGITGSAELQRNLCFCRGTIFAEIKGLIAARWYPQLCEDRNLNRECPSSSWSLGLCQKSISYSHLHIALSICHFLGYLHDPNFEQSKPAVPAHSCFITSEPMNPAVWKGNRMEPDVGTNFMVPRLISWTAQRILESLRRFQVDPRSTQVIAAFEF